MRKFIRYLSILVAAALIHGLATKPAGATFLQRDAGQTPIKEDVYWALIRNTKNRLAILEDRPEEEIKRKLPDLASRWETITAVDVDGQIVPVNNEYLLRLMRAEQPELKQARGLLSALLKMHESHPEQVFSTADLDPLHKILSQPEFSWAEPKPNPINNWLQKIWEAFNRWLNRIFGDDTITFTVNPDWLGILASILLAILLILIFRSLVRDLAGEAHINNRDDAESEPLTSEAAFEKAQVLSRGGDYRSAVRYLYLSSLLLLDERGLLRYDRSKTNREYLRTVANSPELAKPLNDVIEVFDNVWYGYHPLEKDTFEHYCDRVEELKGKES